MSTFFSLFSVADIAAMVSFLVAWSTYHFLVERTDAGRKSLNRIMNGRRLDWMEEMGARDVRIADAAINASLQNGTAFFASTSLFALGGAASLLRATDDILKVFSDLPFALATSRSQWEIKVLGLMIILGYAFFKFSWSYRLFNYTAIMIGATPTAKSPDATARKLAAMRAGCMNIVAGSHFSRGQRAFFFALAYLGWFVSPYVLIATTGLTLWAMWSRQFSSDARRAALMQLPLSATDENAANLESDLNLE